jgi:hypothetical protein
MEEPVVLQSGFVAVPNNNYVIDPPTNEEDFMMRDTKYNNHIIRMQSSYAYHGGVNKVYQEFLVDPLQFQTFEKQEEVYRAIYNAFGTFSFKEWILLQNNNPHLLRHQKEFIEDVYRLLRHEMPVISFATWSEIIHAEGFKAGSDTDTFYNTDSPVSTLTDFIQRIMEIRSGLNHLIMVAGIIFGNKLVPILA